MGTFYEVQYDSQGKVLWVHSSEGETVGRFNAFSGMDIHCSIEEQMKTGQQCLHCTHTKPTKEDFDLFCEKAKELWNIEIDKTKINLDD